MESEGVSLEREQGISGFIVDGLQNKLIVEFYGDIYHCNPRHFRDPDEFCSWIGRTVTQQWARDRKRLGVFYKLGYRVVIVWEADWKTHPENEIRRVKNALSED